jgi:uncharacterized membrane protein
MNVTDILKFLHVLSAAIWVGGGFMLQVLLSRAKAAGPDTVASFNELAEWTHRLFMAASFLTLLFGIGTVASGGYDWGAPWIGIGFAGFLASGLLGMAVLGPTATKMKALIGERGPNDPVVAHLGRRLDMVGRLDLVILIFVVFAMVTKLGQ